MAPVVLADHDDSEFGGDPIDIAVVESPDDVLGAVTTNSQVEGLPGSVVVIPNRFSDPFIALNDGVPDIDQVDVSLLGLGVHRFVTLHPSGFGHRNGNGCGIVGLGESVSQSRQDHQKESRSNLKHNLFYRVFFMAEK